MKEQSWLPYKRKAKVVEINVKDHDEQTLDFFKIYNKNTKDLNRILNLLKDKYDFDLLNSKRQEKELLDKDLRW